MSQQERWDVVLKVLSGPLAGLGEQVLRGPVVRIGVNPGPGGLQLTGYRGLDARHAVITAYDGGSANIAPVGTNQVRLAPHAHVNWKEIDPVTSPQYLNAGGAIHLGPVGRGATLEFVKCERLGVWTGGHLASQVSDVSAVQARGQGAGGGPPAAYDARKAGTIRTSNVPAWFIGCLVLMFSGASSVMCAGGAWMVIQKEPEPLGPTQEGEYFKDYATVDKAKLAEFGLLEGLQEPFAAFVMKHNVEASGKNRLTKHDNWDQQFYDRVAASVYQHVQYRKVFTRFEEIKDEYAEVTLALRDAGLPEVFAGVPYRESQYRPDLTSKVCAKGWWQFMPETAYRLESKEGMDFVVRDCRFKDAPDAKWSPTEVTPPRNVLKNGKYMSPSGECRISKCDVDDRTDLAKSTAAAVFSLKEAMDDELLRSSGAVVQIAIASHNAGYDDSRFGVKKTSNLKPAYQKWSSSVSEDDQHTFYGANITCTEEAETGYCGGSPLHSETQHYVYPIVARHILAVCYYAKNHPEMAAFQPWTQYVEGDGYCTRFNIPDMAAVKK